MTLNFSFDPAAGYSAPYVVVAFGNTNPNIPLGQTTIAGYGAHISGTIAGLPSDAPFTYKVFTGSCLNAVGIMTNLGVTVGA